MYRAITLPDWSISSPFNVTTRHLLDPWKEVFLWLQTFARTVLRQHRSGYWQDFKKSHEQLHACFVLWFSWKLPKRVVEYQKLLCLAQRENWLFMNDRMGVFFEPWLTKLWCYNVCHQRGKPCLDFYCFSFLEWFQLHNASTKALLLLGTTKMKFFIFSWLLIKGKQQRSKALPDKQYLSLAWGRWQQECLWEQSRMLFVSDRPWHGPSRKGVAHSVVYWTKNK